MPSVLSESRVAGMLEDYGWVQELWQWHMANSRTIYALRNPIRRADTHDHEEVLMNGNERTPSMSKGPLKVMEATWPR